jgi:hypothetical protein
MSSDALPARPDLDQLCAWATIPIPTGAPPSVPSSRPTPPPKGSSFPDDTKPPSPEVASLLRSYGIPDHPGSYGIPDHPGFYGIPDHPDSA